LKISASLWGELAIAVRVAQLCSAVCMVTKCFRS